MTCVPDRSSGYQAAAAAFLRVRDPRIGRATVARWARTLPPGGSVLDLGCGHGVPVTEALLAAGLRVYGVDAAEAMVAAYRVRFPEAEVACEAVESSAFFGRTYDGIVASGLLFLLEADAQRDLIRRAAASLRPNGSFLFTAPAEACTWTDVLTGRPSRSLGRDGYRDALAAAGLTLTSEHDDEGGNHYFEAARHMTGSMEADFPLAGPDDGPVLDVLMREFYALEHLEYRDEVVRALRELWDRPELGRVYLLRADGETAGYVVLTFGFSLEFHGRDALVDELYVREPFRGRGLGTACLRHVEALCRAEGIRAVHLEVDHGNAPAKRLYHRLGYRDHDRHLLTRWLPA
jgi:ribosomal protein S18 acetylase RimI-like enzyme